jgi:4'-phosphopantetheinyl transferase
MMPLQVEVYYTCLPAKLEFDFLEKNLKLFPNIAAEVQSYQQAADKYRVFTGKMLLNWILIQKNYATELMHQIERNNFGRPYISGISADFNLSHSGNLVVCGWSIVGKIGVDVEEIRPIDLADFQHYLTENEKITIQESSNHLTKFYEIWTRKEAFFKSIGKGYLDDFQAIDCQTDWVCNLDYARRLFHIRLADGYAAAVSVEKPVKYLHIENIDFQLLFLER